MHASELDRYVFDGKVTTSSLASTIFQMFLSISVFLPVGCFHRFGMLAPQVNSNRMRRQAASCAARRPCSASNFNYVGTGPLHRPALHTKWEISSPGIATRFNLHRYLTFRHRYLTFRLVSAQSSPDILPDLDI